MWEETDFLEAPDDTAVLWRYMDFTKFLWTLENGQLFFPRAATLPDRFEATLTEVRWWETEAGRAVFDADTGLPTQLDDSRWDVIAEDTQRSQLLIREQGFVNCWHESPHDSAAMWDTYLTGNDGVAMCTTTDRFRCAFEPWQEAIQIGKVSYIDFSRGTIPETNIFSQFFFKRLNFESEKEVRALSISLSIEVLEGKIGVGTLPNGIGVDVDLPTLIDAVWVAPRAPEWVVDLVRSTVDRFNLDIPVTQSRLYADP